MSRTAHPGSHAGLALLSPPPTQRPAPTAPGLGTGRSGLRPALTLPPAPRRPWHARVCVGKEAPGRAASLRRRGSLLTRGPGHPLPALSRGLQAGDRGQADGGVSLKLTS